MTMKDLKQRRIQVITRLLTNPIKIAMDIENLSKCIVSQIAMSTWRLNVCYPWRTPMWNCFCGISGIGLFVCNFKAEEILWHTWTETFVRYSWTEEFLCHSRTEEFVRHSWTQDFVRHSWTEDFVRHSRTEEFVGRSWTEDFVRHSLTEYFVRHSRTEKFVRRSWTEDFVWHSWTEELFLKINKISFKNRRSNDEGRRIRIWFSRVVYSSVFFYQSGTALNGIQFACPTITNMWKCQKNILEEWHLFLKRHQKNITLNGHIQY